MKLLDNKTCCGCGACIAACKKNCIHFTTDNHLQKIPVIDNSKCIECGLCRKVCPIISPRVSASRDTNAYIAFSQTPATLAASSSGGVMKELERGVMEFRGGGCAGATYSEDYKSARHKIAWTEKECECFRGSKYLQSNMEGIHREIKHKLDAGKYIAFTGTPCQVASIYGFLGREYENLLTCDLICDGVANPAVFSQYITYIERIFKKKVTCINMKDKTQGWLKPKLRVTFEDHTSLTDTYETKLWARMCGSKVVMRTCCLNCKFSSPNRVGDITLGDYWKVQQHYPGLINPMGTSLVLANTDKGKKMLEMLKDSLQIYPVEAAKALSHPNLFPAKKIPAINTDEFYQYLSNRGFAACSAKFFPRPSVVYRIRHFIKRLLINA